MFEALPDNAVLILDELRGKYIPQKCAEDMGDLLSAAGADPETLDILFPGGPDHPDYWEAWEQILKLTITDERGNRWTFHHDGDLWLVPAD